MKTILIPTNFDEESLQLIKSTILLYPETKLMILLVAGYKERLNTYGLLYYSIQKILKKTVKTSFLEKIDELKIEHKRSLLNVKFKIFLESNRFSFDNFLKENKVDLAVIPKNISEGGLKKNFFSVIPQIKKCTIHRKQIRLRVNPKF